MAEAVGKGSGCYLATVDDDVATDTVMAYLVIVAAANAHCKDKSGMNGLNFAAIDGDAAAGDVVLVATDSGRILSTTDIDVAAVDDERAHLHGTDGRLVFVAIKDFQLARTVDGQLITFAQLDALRCCQAGAGAEVEDNVAVDLDARRNLHVFIHGMYATVQFGRAACDGHIV